LTLRFDFERDSFEPDQIAVMASAYDRVCERLDLTSNAYSVANDVVAQKIISIVQAGETEVERIASLAIEQLTSTL